MELRQLLQNVKISFSEEKVPKGSTDRTPYISTETEIYNSDVQPVGMNSAGNVDSEEDDGSYKKR